MMQVSTMARIPGRDEALEAQLRQQQQLYGQPRTMSNPYVMPASTQTYGYPYQQQRAPAQSPPSPPGDDLHKLPSLPSISSLLGMAEDVQVQAQQATQQSQQQTMMTQNQQYDTEVMSHAAGPVISSHGKGALPPTPPLGPESLIEGDQSPSGISAHSAVSASPFYMHNPMSHMDPSQHRHSYSAAVSRSTMMPQTVVSSPFQTTSYSASAYNPSPTTLASHTSYYPTEAPILPSSGLFAQRPLPSNFPPPVHIPMSAPSGGSNPWQHHHYINHSSQSAFPQSQDRYICPTCNKAFSRPSSLRIHSHSHTGEKPFKCSHSGCGKAFSVRSNMKRHERGCHAGSSSGMMSHS